jgi:hypothetical protein
LILGIKGRKEYAASSLIASPEGDWNVNAFSDIRELFFDPKANRASARNVWLVQQANLYVTQVGFRS